MIEKLSFSRSFPTTRGNNNGSGKYGADRREFAGHSKLESAFTNRRYRRTSRFLALVLIGCLFDSFEQNTIGVAGPILKEHWGLTGTDIGFLKHDHLAAPRSGDCCRAFSATATAGG